MMLTEGQRDAWVAYWRNVGSEEWLTAKALLELSPALHGEAASWVAVDGYRDGLRAWIDDVDENGRGWSSTESRLYRLVAALIDPHPDADAPRDAWETSVDGRVRRVVPVSYFLELMGSWEGDVWRILTEWGTGGNNREHRGRYTVTRTSPSHTNGPGTP